MHRRAFLGYFLGGMGCAMLLCSAKAASPSAPELPADPDTTTSISPETAESSATDLGARRGWGRGGWGRRGWGRRWGWGRRRWGYRRRWWGWRRRRYWGWRPWWGYRRRRWWGWRRRWGW